jgi:hypothetical protein
LIDFHSPPSGRFLQSFILKHKGKINTCILQWAAQAVCPAGLGCPAVAQPPFQPTARSRPPCPVGCSLRPVSTHYSATVFKCFSIILNFRNCFKLKKFIETCRNVQNLQNKFCVNPLESLFTVGWTKLTFTR